MALVVDRAEGRKDSAPPTAAAGAAPSLAEGTLLRGLADPPAAPPRGALV